MRTVHLIFNAHIDPVWLWPWQEGLDVALATCRSACDLLDCHHDLTFSQGEAWVYHQIEQIDPILFRRITRHVRSGRWEIVGGWWVQPDCNFPGGIGLQKQIELGRKYFQKRFGLFPPIAYNVDSFGHAATLPGLMRAAGQTCYIMMRPQEHEMKLPARLFRWRGFKHDKDVVTFRIAASYGTDDITLDHIRRSLTELPQGIDHTMCFVGLGDHGGGPTERQIAWCRANAEAIEDTRLVFSTPSRFFAAIKPKLNRLPTVTGELQHHAIGCYTVYRSAKTQIRRAEHLLVQARIMLDRDPHPPRDASVRLDDSWRRVCTHHFHDTLGGTCIPSAYDQVAADLGHACSSADELIQYASRRRAGAIRQDPRQRIVFFNASDSSFDGYVSFEPWVDWRAMTTDLRLVDEKGRLVDSQLMEPEAVIPRHWRSRLLLRIKAPAGGMRVLKLGADVLRRKRINVAAAANHRAISTIDGMRVSATGSFTWPDGASLRPKLMLMEDPSDTWSHGLDRYIDGPAEAASWQPPVIVDRGPLMASYIRSGRIGQSDLLLETRVYFGWPLVECHMRVHWRQSHKTLKLVLPFDEQAITRVDGIPHGHLDRQLDGAERPLRDWSLFTFANGHRLGVVCPDVFALDATSHRGRLTLLRSPIMAHHEPRVADSPRGQFADQGIHEFRFRFLCGATITPDIMERHALMLQRPLIRVDVTHGMAGRVVS